MDTARLARLVLPIAASAVAALLAGCSFLSSAGPLGPSSSAGDQQCMSASLSHRYTDAAFVLQNSSASPVTVRGVSLVAPDHVRVTKAWLQPVLRSKDGYTIMGVLPWWPPPAGSRQQSSGLGSLLHMWASRQPIPGAVIKPGQLLNLVFGLTQTSTRGGSLDGAEITYTANRTSYVLQDALNLRLGGGCVVG
jgi:hypothetical protein